MATKTKAQLRWYDAAIHYGLLTLPIIVPLLFHANFYTVFSGTKLFALCAITLFIILFWGLKIFIEEKIELRKGPLNWLLLTYGAVLILSTIFSIAPLTSIFGAHGRFVGLLTMLNMLFLAFLAYNLLRDESHIKKFITVTIITSTVAAIYGILQFFGLFQDGFQWSTEVTDRVFSTVGHGNHLAAYLGMTIMLSLFMLPLIKKKTYSYLLLTAILTQTVTLVLTGSRGGLIATIIALIMISSAVVAKNWRTASKKIWSWILAAFVILSIIVSATIIFWEDVKKLPFFERTEQTIAAIDNGYIPDRISWWRSSIDMVEERPLLGFGVSTFSDAFNRFRRPDFQTLEPGNMEDRITPEHAHNEYFNIAATQGLLGLVAFLALVLFILFRLDKMATKETNKTKSYLAFGLKAALLVYLLQIVLNFGVIATLTVFFLLLGAGASLAAAPKTKKYVTTSLCGLPKYIITVLILLLVCGGLYITFNRAAAEVHYKTALTLGAQRNYAAALDAFSQMAALHPFEYIYFQAAGDFALKASEQAEVGQQTKTSMLNSAVKNYEFALQINDHHPSTYYNLGVAELQLYAITASDAHYQLAGQSFAQAAEKAVNNAIYPYYIGRAYHTIDTPDAQQKARQYFERALQIRNPYLDIADYLQ